MPALKAIARRQNPRDYKDGDKWEEIFWKEKYFDKGTIIAATPKIFGLLLSVINQKPTVLN